MLPTRIAIQRELNDIPSEVVAYTAWHLYVDDQRVEVGSPTIHTTVRLDEIS